MKPAAADMIEPAYSHIGTPYSVMDCQAFVETCLRDIGIRKDLPGSNTWYRQMDWVGSPEECRQRFGVIPAGAFLFILEQDGKEPSKYQGDGVGNASHIGIYTGIRQGAVHSSASKGEVCESKFSGKTIPNGGWNRVGLWSSALEYGLDMNDGDDGSMPTTAVVVASHGSDVKMRAKPSTSCSTYWDVPVGSLVAVYEESNGWAYIGYNNLTGYMMVEFLQPVEVPGPDPGDSVRLTLTAEQAKAILEIADMIRGGGQDNVVG